MESVQQQTMPDWASETLSPLANKNNSDRLGRAAAHLRDEGLTPRSSPLHSVVSTKATPPSLPDTAISSPTTQTRYQEKITLGPHSERGDEFDYDDVDDDNVPTPRKDFRKSLDQQFRNTTSLFHALTSPTSARRHSSAGLAAQIAINSYRSYKNASNGRTSVGGLVASTSFDASNNNNNSFIADEQEPGGLLETSFIIDDVVSIKPEFSSGTCSFDSLALADLNDTKRNAASPASPRVLTPLKPVSAASKPPTPKSFSLSGEYTSPLSAVPLNKRVSSPAGRSYSTTPSKRVTINNDRKSLSEFDPLATFPRDWMMQFESPVANNSNGPLSTPSSNQQGFQHHSATPPQSLLDSIVPIATPNSMLKYSERDFQDMKQMIKASFEKEFDVAQLEIQELTLNADNLRAENMRMKETLNQWEQAVKQMITEKEQYKRNKQVEIESLNNQINMIVNERDQVKRESDAVLLKYKQLRVDFSDVKEIEEKQREVIAELETSLATSTQRFESLRKHAEEKLDEANVEIARVRGTYEKEQSTLRAKLSRVELTMQTLDRNLKSKEQENKELTKICDDLVAQMEQMGN